MVAFNKRGEPFVEHHWFTTEKGVKCALCGAVARERPPSPTPEEWTPERYERLTDDERARAAR